MDNQFSGAFMTDVSVSNQQMLIEASSHLSSAIDLLDHAAAPGQIAAHADLALNQLKEFISEAYRELENRHRHDDQGCDEIESLSTVARTG
jgi:hypothetical protein